jgi:hypothetical protein
MSQHESPPPYPKPGWAVYLRTSTDENQRPELSRERQRAVIEQSVLARSVLPRYREYVDVLSGKNPNRKEYQRMLADARKGRFSHVIVERADRFGRSDGEALRAIDELNEYGVAVSVSKTGKCKPLVDKLLRAFQDWTYAGWVVNEADGIAPKTIRGNWEALVSTEDFERGLKIIEKFKSSR